MMKITIRGSIKTTKTIFKLGHSFGSPSEWGFCLLAKEKILKIPSIFITINETDSA